MIRLVNVCPALASAQHRRALPHIRNSPPPPKHNLHKIVLNEIYGQWNYLCAPMVVSKFTLVGFCREKSSHVPIFDPDLIDALNKFFRRTINGNLNAFYLLISFFFLLLSLHLFPLQHQMETSNIRGLGIVCRSGQLCGLSARMCIKIWTIGRFTVRQSIDDVRCSWYVAAIFRIGGAEFSGQCGWNVLSARIAKQYERHARV